jgi:vitamin B12 transporter
MRVSAVWRHYSSEERVLKKCGYAFFIGIIAIALPLAVSAQVRDADTIVVTANRTGLVARKVGSAVSVITSEDFEQGQILLAKDVLQDVPGLQISNDRPGAVTSVSIRGADNDQVLVLLDGLEMGDPSNISTAFQFDHLNAADIERIEVIRGNQSSLYGSDAIGGVINLITRKPQEGETQYSVDAEAGSFGMRRLDAGVAADLGRMDIRFSANSLSAEGPSRADPTAGPASEDDGYDRTGFSAQLGIALTDGLRLRLQRFHSDSRTDLDGTGQDQTFLPDIDKDESLSAMTLVFDQPSGRWQHELALSRYDAERFYDATGDRYAGDKENLRVVSAFDAGPMLALAFGLDHEQESTDQLTSFSGSFLAGNETDSVFAEAAITPIDRFTLTIAARLDDNERFGRFDTLRTTVAYLLPVSGPEAKLRASFGTGAKAPGLFQLFDPTFGNAALEVEESQGFDLGVNWLWEGGATLDFSYFSLDIENEIDFEWPTGYLNRGSTQAKGIEAWYSRPLGSRFDWSVSYTYLDARDRSANSWIGRPRNAATMQFAVAVTDALRFTARARHRSQNAASFGGNTAGFVVWDLLAHHELSENLQVYGRLVNLFDEDYQYEWGASTYDRSIFAGIRMRY